MLGGIEDRRRRGHRMRWLDAVIGVMDVSLSQLWETVKDGEVWRAAVHGVLELEGTWRLNKNTHRARSAVILLMSRPAGNRACPP